MKYILYHSSCYDGFGAAYAAWKRFGEAAKYIPVSYGYLVPEMSEATEVFILDFCYPADVLTKICNKHKTVILDHHKTAQEALQSFSHTNATIVFDMEKSGALLAWEYFHPVSDVPLLIQHISDRDLWKFKMDGSAKIHKALVSYPMDFALWDKFDVEELKKEGEICERLYSQIVTNICKKPFLIEIGGHKVLGVNTSMAWSEVGEELLNRKETPFVASFTIFEDQVMWSLRSEGDFDVSAIAKQYGGGGHKNAAGFKTPRNTEILL